MTRARGAAARKDGRKPSGTQIATVSAVPLSYEYGWLDWCDGGNLEGVSILRPFFYKVSVFLLGFVRLNNVFIIQRLFLQTIPNQTKN